MDGRQLTTTRHVIEALGGIQAVATLTGRKYTAAANWNRGDTFPSDTYLAMTKALEAKGLTALYSLWDMVEPKSAAAE